MWRLIRSFETHLVRIKTSTDYKTCSVVQLPRQPRTWCSQIWEKNVGHKLPLWQRRTMNTARHCPHIQTISNWRLNKLVTGHSPARIVDNKARHLRHSLFLWLGTDLPTCLWEFRDETRTGQDCGRWDKCTLHTLVFILTRAVSMRISD